MRHDMESCGSVEKIKTRLSVDAPVASVKGKSEALERRTAHGEKVWAMTWRQWTRATVKSYQGCDRRTKGHMMI